MMQRLSDHTSTSVKRSIHVASCHVAKQSRLSDSIAILVEKSSILLYGTVSRYRYHGIERKTPRAHPSRLCRLLCSANNLGV